MLAIDGEFTLASVIGDQNNENSFIKIRVAGKAVKQDNSVVISAIIAVYNNEFYAKDLYRSLEAQKLDPNLFEIVLIDDGSTDTSLSLAREWQKGSNLNVKVLTKENGGVASARNLGISNAIGHWLAFVDSDDLLDKSYFSSLFDFTARDRSDSASILTTRSIIFDEGKGTTVDNHPLSWKYKRGDRLVDINLEPHVVHLAGHSSVVRRSIVMDNDIRFSQDVRPGFEDAHFNGRYLSYFSRPIIGLVASARYYYRKRANGTSLIDTTWTKSEKFSHEPRYGHLGLLQEVTERLGYTPIWAQNTVLYAQYWYFSADRSWNSPMKSVSQELLDEYWQTLGDIFEYIDAATIRNFALRNFGWYMSEGILRRFKNQAWASVEEYVAYQWGESDPRRHIRKYVYSYSKALPREQFYLNDEEISPIYTKSIRHSAFGNHLMYERIVYLPSVGRLAICLNGKKVRISNLPSKNRLPKFRADFPEHLSLNPAKSSISPQQQSALFYREDAKLHLRIYSGVRALYGKSVEESWVNGSNVFVAALGITLRVINRRVLRIKAERMHRKDKVFTGRLLASDSANIYQHAWIFLDRPDRADDNAEHLYRFVLQNHEDINAWFLLSPDSKDWPRLAAEGFRLIPFGAEESIVPVLKAKYIISSHADLAAYSPIDEKRFGSIKAKRIFLQHGMTKDDLSEWLNTKNFALMATCAVQERESIVGDGSPYRLTRREVKLTGFPRHDGLVALAKSHTVEDRNVILIIPTWRKDLADQLHAAITADDKREVLLASEFYCEWRKLTNSEAFIGSINRCALRVVFVLHDQLAIFSHLFEFNRHIEVLKFSEMSVQHMLVSAKVLITDYSSMSTEAAVAGCSVVHYQFDSAKIFDGSHSYNKGWMDYDTDAFGPVCQTINDFEDTFLRLESNDWNPDNIYIDRLSKTLPILDGSSCSRVVREVLALDSVKVSVL